MTPKALYRSYNGGATWSVASSTGSPDTSPPWVSNGLLPAQVGSITLQGNFPVSFAAASPNRAWMTEIEPQADDFSRGSRIAIDVTPLVNTSCCQWREPSHQQLAVPPGALASRTPQGLGHAGLRPVLVEVHLIWQRELLKFQAA